MESHKLPWFQTTNQFLNLMTVGQQSSSLDKDTLSGSSEYPHHRTKVIDFPAQQLKLL